MSVTALSASLKALLNGTDPGGPLGQRSPAVALGTIIQNIITQVNANEAALTANTALGVLINSDATAGVDQDPYLEFVGGDGGSEVLRGRFTLDSSIDVLYYQLGGGTAGTTRKTPTLTIGKVGETTAGLDAVLGFAGSTDGGSAKAGIITFRGQENTFEFGDASNNPAYNFLGSGTLTAPTGGIKVATLDEATAGVGISLGTGEIIAVPKTLKSQVDYNTADGAVWTVPTGETWLITDMWFQTGTDWDGDGAFVVGVTADADGFLTLANSSLDPAYDETGGATGWPTGSRGLDFVNRGPLLSTPTTGYPRHFRAVAGTTILLDNTPGTSSAGSGFLFMTYIRLP